MPKQIHFGLFLLGAGCHMAGWRMPGALDNFESITDMVAISQEAERGLFDMIFVGDGLGANLKGHPGFASRLEPVSMLSAIAMATKHIGLGATSSTTYGDPWTVARAFSTLDHISAGRAAWNVVTSSGSGAAANFGRDHPDHASRYEMSGEFVDVVKQLWDAWAPGALVKDADSGVYFDETKVHEINHKGRFYDVKGPLNISRPPQGRPVILQAGSSEAGQELAAQHADVVFTVTHDIDDARAFYASLKGRLAKYGRTPEDLVILPGMMPVVGATQAEALEKLAQVQGFIADDGALDMLSMRLGMDMSGHDLDGPVPDVPVTDNSRGFADAIMKKARKDDLSLRDLFNLVAAARGHWVLPGTPESIADTLVEWVDAEAADGFIVNPAWFMGALTDFVDTVVPELQARGRYRTAYKGPHLRDHLGLAMPEIPPVRQAKTTG
ncbi:MAG: nitrilotriacetate monooxygenase [Rhodobacteraceae bacterium]|nr:nitrilotriacetate monooxygenase [Paracoccaceae bacterium]MAY45095.1 nitrilotriacetate monooxygenase [Paracoccaceae bacterium]